MSEGTLLQLVAKGAQDEFLEDNGNKKDEKIPYSIFDNSYSKHTSFSKNTVYLSGNGNFGENICFKLPKEGDKIYTIYLKVTLPELDITKLDIYKTNDKLRIKWNDYIGFCLIENLQLKIGGQTIV